MKKYLFAFTSFILVITNYGCLEKSEENNKLVLWYNKPAKEWNEALPVGNGRLGAMVFGGIEKERIQLNEESIWTGSQIDTMDKSGGAKYLPDVRKLLFEGNYYEAQKLVKEKMMGEYIWNSYQMLGDLDINFEYQGKVSDYYRDLDLKNAIATTLLTAGETKYKREVFSSAVDQAVVVRISANQDEKISLSAKLTRPKDCHIKVDKNGIIVINGQVTVGPPEIKDINPGVIYEGRLKVKNDGGELTIAGDSIIVRNAHSVFMYIVAATNYRGDNPSYLCDQYLSSVKDKDYKTIKKDHIKDYQRLFNRVSLDLGVSDTSLLSKPINERMDLFKLNPNDPDLLETYFQYGRYMLIGSSRPGCLPANLQGIWADGLTPPWSADYHININIQMNYWPSEITNLAECQLPFIEFIDNLRKNGRVTAKTTYGCEGFVSHYASDVWHWTAAVGEPEWGMWPMGAAWCCQHLWEHYAFNNDSDYLASVYPILKEASVFFVDYLVVHPKTGYLVSGPSSSPENRFKTEDGKISNLTMGPTMDMQIIRELFTNTIASSEILGLDPEFRDKLTEMKSKLSPNKIGSDGRLMEWVEEFEEPEPGHRHVSHLYGLHPGNQISVINTPELAAAARKSLDYRLSHGGAYTGWSRAWMINFFARLHDGETAYENLVALLQKSTLSNLFDTHPPFQIDGNFGGTAGITEMIVQSQDGEINLLPALPKAWSVGTVKGLCARGGFEVDINWKNGKLEKAFIKSKNGNTCHVRFGEKTASFDTEKGETVTLNGELVKI